MTWSTDPPTNWYEHYAAGVDMDGAFAAWIKLVDDKVSRWLKMDFSDFDCHCDAKDCYISGMTPDEFVQRILIPIVEIDFGCDWVASLVFDNIFWGDSKSR